MQEADNNSGSVKMASLIKYLDVQMNGFKFLDLLAREFDQVELLEQVGFFYKVRIPKHDHTIGFIFSLIQSKKDEWNINDYGVQ